MKKTILILASFLLMLPALKADVVIEGIGMWMVDGDGKAYIECRLAHRDCVRIVSSTAVINFEDGHQETIFNIDGYEILYETETATDVVIYGGNH